MLNSRQNRSSFKVHEPVSVFVSDHIRRYNLRIVSVSMLVVFYCIIRNRCPNDDHCSKCQGLLVSEEFSVSETLASAPSSASLRMALFTFLVNLTDYGLSLRLCIARVKVLVFHFVFDGLTQILLRRNLLELRLI